MEQARRIVVVARQSGRDTGLFNAYVALRRANARAK